MRYLIYSLILLLSLCLVGCNFDFDLSSCNPDDIKVISEFTYKESEKYNEYEDVVTIDEKVDKIEISWVSGEIEILKGEVFSINEECLNGQYYPLYWNLEDGTIDIKYVKNGTSNSLLNDLKKKLVVTSPIDLDKIKYSGVSASISIELDQVTTTDIDNVSGEINIKFKTSDNIDIDDVSGKINLEIEEAGDIDIDSVSGESNLILTKAESIDVNTISGDVLVELSDTKALREIEIDTTSADVVLKLDDERGYKLSFKTVSGKKNTEFSDGTNTSLSKFEIDVETISGDVTIEKLNK